MTSKRVPHYIKPNEANRIPRRHIFLDSEALSDKRAWGEIQTWRVAIAGFYDAEKGRKEHYRTDTFRKPEHLWEAVSLHATKRDRTILWCHNLSYDIRITECLPTLVKLGWRLDAHNLRRRGTWLIWRRDSATLIMVDSSSVFPATLQEVGKKFGMQKLKLPTDLDSDEAWEARCRQDVAILRTAVVEYLKWLEREDMGNWQMTGSAQAWAAFRHKHLTHKMLVHDDMEALAAERRAMWTGRCEAYWHGAMPKQVLHEWDMSLAYPRIAASVNVPVRLIGPMPRGYDWRKTFDNKRIAFLAEVDVEIGDPIVPSERDGRILWGVGKFSTTLWDVEIRAVLDAGGVVTVKRGWLYRAEPALQQWGRWVISELSRDDRSSPAWLKMIYKHWGRAVIGRIAMTYTAWEDFGQLPFDAVRRWEVIDTVDGTHYDMMQVGHKVWRQGGITEWDSSMPAITGYVMAVCRVWLLDIIRALPRDALLYVDTDSVFTTDRWHNAVDGVSRRYPDYGLRLKRSWQGFAIYGPRQIITERQIRISGIPVSAVHTARHELTGQIWESLDKASKDGRFTSVRIMARNWKVKGVDRRRDGPPIGWTHPIALSLTEG